APPRAHSSVGRARPLQGWGRQFEPVCAHSEVLPREEAGRMPPPALPSSGARRVRPSPPPGPPPGRRRASGGTRVGRLFTLHGGMVGPPKRLASGESGRGLLLAARPPLSPRGRSGV